MPAPIQAQVNPFQVMADFSIPEIPAAKSLAQQKKDKLAESRSSKMSALSGETPEEVYARLYPGENVNSSASSSGPIDAFQAGFMTTMGKGAELVGEGIESAGELVGSDQVAQYGTQIQQEQQQWRNEGKWNDFVGYDPKPVQQMGAQFADSWEKGNYFEAVGGLAQPAAVSALANSVTEMVIMANPWGLGTVMASNVNKNLNDLGPNATDEQRAISVGLSVVGTALDRLGDKVVLGGGEKALTSMIKSMSKPAQEAVFNVYGKSLVRLGIGAGAFIGKAGFEGATEGTQTLLEGKASDAELMNFAIAEKERREALEATGIGMGAGGVVAAPKAAKEVAATAGVATIRGVGKGVEKGIDFAHKKAVEANYKVISQDQRDEIQATYKDNATAYKKSEDANNAAASSIKNTTTVDELKALNDPEVDVAIDSILDSDNKIKERRKSIYEAESFKDLEVDAWTIGKIAAINSSNESKVDYSLEEMKDRLQAEITNSYTPADLNANIDKIKNEAIAQYNKRNTADKAALEAIRAKDFVYQASANLYEGTKAAVEKALPKALRDEIIKQAKAGVDIAKVGIDVATAELKNLDKSTARAMMDDLTKGKMHKGIDTFSRKQLGELKTAFKNNEKATKVLNKAIERKNKISAEFDKVTKKDVKFFDAVVDTAGKIKNSNIAAQIRGLGIITEDFLTDSGNLSRAKSLVKELEKAKKEDPTKFSKADQARLYDNKRKVLKAIRNEEQGAINNALRKIDKALTKNQVERRSIIALKQAKRKIVSLSKKTYTSLEESELLKNLNKSLDDLSKKLEEYGDDVDVAPEAKAKPKKSTTEKVDVTEDVVEVVNSSEVSEKELAEILEDSSTIEADNEVSTAPDKPLDAKLTKEEIATIDLLDSMFCNKG